MVNWKPKAEDVPGELAKWRRCRDKATATNQTGMIAIADEWVRYLEGLEAEYGNQGS